MRRSKGFDPLAVIPSPKAIRERLEEIQEQARRLGILLRTAEEIERDGRQSEVCNTNAGQPEGVANDPH